MPDHAQDLSYRLEVLRGAHRLKSCYLAGPMTGLPEFNMHAFNLCAEHLKAAGFEVHNPVAVDAEHGIVLEGTNGHEEFDFLEAMKRDLPLVMDADCVIVMPGWEESKGAQLEVHTALETGVPVYTILSQREIKTGSAPEASAPSRTRAGTGEGENRVSSSPTNRHPNSARFHKLVQEIGDLHDRKQQDYGSDTDPFANVRASTEWGVPAWVGALVRLNDKVTRLKSFARKGSLANESAEDSMRDIAVYALIALVLYEQEQSGSE